jgi:hypothetical protein
MRHSPASRSLLARFAGATALAIALVAARGGTARAQTSSASVNVNATAASNLYFTSLAGNSQTITIGDNTLSVYAPITLGLAWDLSPSSTKDIYVVAYFMSSAALVHQDDATVSVASSNVELWTTATGTWQKFTAPMTTPVATPGPGLQVFRTAVTASNRKSTASVTMNLRINLTGQTIAPGLYSGTLLVRAVAQ